MPPDYEKSQERHENFLDDGLGVWTAGILAPLRFGRAVRVRGRSPSSFLTCQPVGERRPVEDWQPDGLTIYSHVCFGPTHANGEPP